MQRRSFLAAVAGAGVTGGLAGCATRPDRRTPTRSGTPDTRLAAQGVPPDVCEGGLVDVGIDAIVGPAFGPDWASVDVPPGYSDTGTLPGEAVVVGVARGGRARAYPLPVLFEHEIVNDDHGGPLLVTFCSLCRSGTAAVRTVDGRAATFGVSGQLWRPPELYARAAEAGNRTFAVERGDPHPGPVRTAGNLVMFDRATRSYWSQLLSRAICGPLRGESLPAVPARTARWTDWRAAHPDTSVLLPPPHSTAMETPA